MRPTENVEKFIRQTDIKTNIKTDDTVLENILNELDESKRTAKFKTNVWRIIMRSPITKLSAAAVIIIAAVITANLLNAPVDVASTVWAKAIERMEKLTDGMHRERMVAKCEGKEIDFLKMDGKKYFSARFGIREDMINQDGFVMQKLYFLRREGIKVTVVPSLKQFKIEQIDTSAFDLLFGSEVKYMVEQLKKEEYKELGQREINGRAAEGFEVTDPGILEELIPIKVDTFVMRGWFDVETYLPVLAEIYATTNDKTVTIFTGGKEIEIKGIADEYKFNTEFEPGTFTPDIGEDYALITDEADSYNEEKAIEGLRGFAEITGGKYPAELNMAEVLLQVCGKSENADEKEKIRKKVIGARNACLFYDRLVKEGKDVAYYGDTVTAGDANKVLMRWKISDSEYRIIYGNLSAETVSE